MTPESKVALALKLALGARPECWLRRTNHGKARVAETGRWVEFGTAGQADYELHLPLAVWFLETKQERGRQYEDQKVFQRLVEAFGGTYLLVKDPAEVVRRVDSYLASLPPEVVARCVAARRNLGDGTV